MAKGKGNISSSRAKELQDRINKAKSGGGMVGAAKQRGEGVPVGGREVEMPNFANQPGAPQPMQPANQPRRPVPPPPPGAGVGAAYSANRKVSFGVDPMSIPHDPAEPNPGEPTQPREGQEGQLKPETVEGLQRLARAQEEGYDTSELPPAPPAEASEIGDGPDPDIRDDLLFGQSSEERELFNLLLDPERRKAIEQRCKPLDFADWIEHLELRQRVPVVPGKFEPQFRTPSGQEDLWVKKEISRETGSDVYVRDKFSVLNLTLALVDINGQIQFSNHLKKDGTVDSAKFKKKLEEVMRLPIQMLNDLSIQYAWFDLRTRRILTVGEVKNG